MQFAELVSRVCENLDRTDLSGSDVDALSATQAGHWVNDTRQNIATKYKFSFYYYEATVDTVAASAVYPLPSDYLDHFTIFCGDTKLSKFSPQNFDENISSSATGEVASNTASGRPVYYIIRGMNFQIYPTPDDAYELLLRYYAKPDAFTASDDTDHVSNLYPDAIINGATARGAIILEDMYNEQRYEQKYTKMLGEMISNEKEKEQGDAHFRLKSWKDFNLGTFANLFRINYDGSRPRSRRGSSNYLDQS